MQYSVVMNYARLVAVVTIISVITHLTDSKFVDISSNYIDNEVDTINLDDNEIVGEAFETSQHQIRYKTQQKYKNIPIFGATLVITQHDGDNKRKIAISGKWYDKSDIEQLIPSIEPKFSKEQTLQIGLNDLDINFSDLYSTATCNLYIYYDNSIPFLCWILKFSYLKQQQQEIHNPVMIINALNGNILDKYDELYDIIEACGDGGTETTGLYQYCVDKTPLLINDNINPVLQNDVIQVYDNMGWSIPRLYLYNPVTCSNLVHSRCDIDDGYTNGAYCPACDAYAFGNIVIEMFDEWTNATYPISPIYKPMKLWVHVNSAGAGYRFNSGKMYFGDGNSTRYPLTSLDIIAHEIAHGYTEQGSKLIYSGQSGAMNEAFSDITGEAAKYFHLGQNDWKVGAKTYKNGNAIRYMYDPPLDGISIDHYTDYYNMDVHFSSGLYNKAAYILNTNNKSNVSWTMEQIFRVFAWANLYYWTPDSTFGEGISGLYHALYDIYDDNITDVDAMADAMEIAFLAVGLSQVRVPVSGVSCGVTETRLCWYANISPSHTFNTNHTAIVQADDSTFNSWENSTYLDLYFIINDNDCIQPSLSLTYELIDFDSSSEYIEVFDNDGVLINQCKYGGQRCGVYDSLCINNYDLGVPAVKIGEKYKITVVETYAIDPLCGGELTLNALFTLHCNHDTRPPTQPTMEPSINPTIEPILQLNHPTIESTAQPSTSEPTAQYSCGSNTFCYDIDVYPSLTQDVVNTVIIQNPNDYSETYFNVFFMISNSDCVAPQLSFEYELIDYDASSEYIDIFDDSVNKIIRCQGSNQCNQFSQCLVDFNIGLGKIIAGQQYRITVLESVEVDSLCSQYHTNSINARLKLTCKAGTSHPTPAPIPTVEPTNHPSTSTMICPYTQGIISCDTKANGIINHGIEHCYAFTPESVSTVTFSSCESILDTTIFVYNKNSEEISQPYCPSGDDCGGCGEFTEEFSIPKMSPNETYYILINSYGSQSGNYTIDVQCSDIFDTNHTIDNSTTSIMVKLYIDVLNYSDPQCAPLNAEYFNISTDLNRCFENGTMVTCSAQNELTSSKYGNADCVGLAVDTKSIIGGRCNEIQLGFFVFLEFECTPTFTPNQTQIPTWLIPTSFNQTTSKPLCEADKCYYEYANQTNTITQIINYDNIDAYLFDIYYFFEDYDCNNPRLTFEYETIDIDAVSEYIRITANDRFIAECGTGVNKCGEIKQCFNNKAFDINIISIGESLKVTIVVSQNSNALCETDDHQTYTINAELKLICNGDVISINHGNESIFVKMNININTIIIAFSACIFLLCVLLFTLICYWEKNRKQKHKQSEDEILDYIDSQLEMTDNKTPPIMNDEMLQQIHETILDEETRL